MFMVLDLMLGGDLRFHLDRMGQLPEDTVRFYVAEISSGLSYLHSKLIVHRDLKPDNGKVKWFIQPRIGCHQDKMGQNWEI
jgi:serine/threonine protein kinase